MRTITISRAGHLTGAGSDREVMRALAQSIVKINATSPLNDITDNSGGTPDVAHFVHLVNPIANAANVPAGGNDLAAVADVNTALTAVQNALKTVYAKANAVAAVIGFAPVAYGGGGVDGAGTVGAIPKSVGAAATGPDQDACNAIIGQINDAVYNLAVLANRIAEACGDRPMVVNPENAVTHLLAATGALTVNAGPDANPGTTQADWTAALLTWGNSLATIIATLNVATGIGTVRVIAVR